MDSPFFLSFRTEARLIFIVIGFNLEIENSMYILHPFIFLFSCCCYQSQHPLNGLTNFDLLWMIYDLKKNLKVWNVYSTFHILHELLIQHCSFNVTHTERFIHLFEWYLHWIIKIFDRTTLQLIDNTISIRYQLMAGNLENLSFQNEAQYFSIIERLLLKQ